MCSVLPNLLQMGKDQQISLPQNLTIEQHQHQQYALKWSEFQSSIINCFQRLRDEEDFVDVTISCDQRSFTAHRVVLSACSPYFRKLLKSNPCKHPIIILRDVRSDDMECLLSFMYNGEVNVAHDQLPDFLKTAHLLQIRGLADVTENWRSSGHITATKPIDNSIILNKKYQHDPDKDNYGVGTAEKANLLPKSKSSSERPVSSTMVSSYSNDMNRSSPVLKEIKTPVPAPENMDLHRNRKILLTPPPQKRIKSADLFRAQHGINTSLPLSEGEFSAISQHSLTRERRHNVSDFERKMERMDVKSTNDESGDDESNCSSDYTIERVGNNQEINDSEDNSRHMMHNVFLGAAKPLEQQSLLNLSDFGTQRQLEIRVRATDPRPCPKCGKIYRSAHTLRTHLEDKHTVCPGYRCVLCGTVAKSRNSLHSHMSRQHRGISTKDLPVLPMPCAFDPILASRLLAKAGVKISPDDLHDRASSANSLNISGGEYGYNNQQDIDNCEKNEQFDDNPEDLTAGGVNFSSGSTSDDNKQAGLLNLEHANASITQMRNDAALAAAVALNQKELSSEQLTTNQPLLDLQLLQFLTENAFGMGITQDPRAAATLHAAKIAHLSAIGKSFDNLPSSLIQAQLDLSKEQNSKGELASKGCRSEGFQIGSILRQHTSYDTPLNDQMFSNIRKEQNTSEISTSKDASQPTTASQAKDVKTYDLIEEGDLSEKKSPNA